MWGIFFALLILSFYIGYKTGRAEEFSNYQTGYEPETKKGVKK